MQAVKHCSWKIVDLKLMIELVITNINNNNKWVSWISWVVFESRATKIRSPSGMLRTSLKSAFCKALSSSERVSEWVSEWEIKSNVGAFKRDDETYPLIWTSWKNEWMTSSCHVSRMSLVLNDASIEGMKIERRVKAEEMKDDDDDDVIKLRALIEWG